MTLRRALKRVSALTYFSGWILSLTLCLVVNGQPAHEDELVVALSSRVYSLDFLRSTSSDSAAESLRPLIFNSLTRRSSNDLSIEGDLAKEITTSRDGGSINLILRSGVKFHDGRSLTAEDVKYTLETLLDASGFKAGAFLETVQTKNGLNTVRLISGITIDGPESVTLRLARPNVRNLVMLNLASIPILPKGSAASEQGTYIGTGPFRVAKFDPTNGDVLLSANPLYWDGKPTISSLRFKTIFEPKQLYAEAASGAVDLFRLEPGISPSELEQFERLQRLQVEAFDGRNIQYVALNLKSPPLTDLNIRKAIAHAIDRPRLIRECFGGNARAADSILPPNSWAHSSGIEYEFNPTKARELIKRSKYKDRKIVIQAPTGSGLFPVIAAIRDSLTRVGLKVEIEFLERSSLLLNLVQGKFQIYVGSWIGGNQDPIFLQDLFHSARIPTTQSFCCNRSQYRNERVDQLLDAAAGETSKEIAAAKYKEAWEIVSAELPLIPLWYPADVIAHDRRVQINSKPSDGFDFLKSVTLAK